MYSMRPKGWMLRLASRGIHFLSLAMSFLGSVGLLVIVVLTSSHVVSRAFLGGGVRGSLEMTEVTLAVVAVAGLGYAQHQRQHVSTTVVTSRLSRRAVLWLDLLWISIAAGLVAWLTWTLAWRGLVAMAAGEQRFGLAEVPIWPARLFLPAAFGTLFLELAVQGFETVAQLRDDPRSLE